MAPIITPKTGLYRKRHEQQKSSLVTICCALDRVFIPHDTRKKIYSGATNSSSFDLRALNSDVKRTFIVSCKLVKQTIHSAFFPVLSQSDFLLFPIRSVRQEEGKCSHNKHVRSENELFVSHHPTLLPAPPSWDFKVSSTPHRKFISVEINMKGK